MNKQEINIDLIRDYFAGKLDAKAMHDLEKCALDDPFLSEAMQGYEHNFTNAGKDLQELRTRLNSKTNKKHFSLKPLLAAASIILLFGLGAFFVWKNQSKKENELAKTIAQNVANETPVAMSADTIKNNSNKNSLAVNTLKESTGNSNPIVKNENIIRQKNVTVPPNTLDKVNKQNNEVAQNAHQDYASTSPSTETFQSDTPKNEGWLANDRQTKTAGVVSGQNNHHQFQIVDSATGAPIASASVITLGNKGIYTDKNGYFYLPDSLKDLHLKINAIGYESKTVAMNDNVIELQQRNDNLNDVVVVGYSAVAKKSASSTQKIHPLIGWEKYKKIIRATAKEKYSAGAKGAVTVQFSISPDGSLHDFIILKGIDNSRNNQAIDILENGPLWQYDSQNTRGTYTVTF